MDCYDMDEFLPDISDEEDVFEEDIFTMGSFIDQDLNTATFQCAYLYQASRKSGTMYGMLLESIQHFIQELHGEGIWTQILENAHLKNMVFTTHKRYNDNIMVTLATSASEVLGDRTSDDYLLFFGQCFVEYFTHYGYDMIMRVSGRHYRDFLNGIDNLHETMRFSYPKMLSPSFYTENEDLKGCTLHYRSKRVGFKHYVIGQLKQCGKKFYGVEVEALVLSETVNDQGCHVVFRLNFENYGFKPAQKSYIYPGIVEYAKIASSTFFKVFPFTLVYNQAMVITHAGETVQALFGTKSLAGQGINDKFILRRPQLEFTWQNVLCLQKVIFELESVDMLRRQTCCDKHNCQCGSSLKATRTVLLKGQMRYIPSLNGVAFLCAPLISNLEEMQTLGLYIHDLNMYDSSRDMVMAGWQHASRLEYSIEKQIEKSKQIAENLRMLDEWRRRSDDLLYSMIPRQIALRLKNGEDPINTCEVFDQVTIMFSYLIHFNDMCANIPALSLVESINSVFTVFDAVIDKYDVFKVETLGDAVYMVAGGVPDRRSNHARSIAAVALDLTNKVPQICLPHQDMLQDFLQIRVGMHTGSVVAGVVGRRMPQYCLFGDTVNTASRMQTYSEAGRIHISEPCNQCLKGSQFVTVFRGKVNIKGKGQMNTYWLAGNRDDPQIRQVCRELKQEHTRNLSLLTASSRNESFFDFRRARKGSEMQISFMFEEAMRRERESSSSAGTGVTTSDVASSSHRFSDGSRTSSITSIPPIISEEECLCFSVRSDDSDSETNSGSHESSSNQSSLFASSGKNYLHPHPQLAYLSPDQSWQTTQYILKETLSSSSRMPGTLQGNQFMKPGRRVSCPFAEEFQEMLKQKGQGGLNLPDIHNVDSALHKPEGDNLIKHTTEFGADRSSENKVDKVTFECPVFTLSPSISATDIEPEIDPSPLVAQGDLSFSQIVLEELKPPKEHSCSIKVHRGDQANEEAGVIDIPDVKSDCSKTSFSAPPSIADKQKPQNAHTPKFYLSPQNSSDILNIHNDAKESDLPSLTGTGDLGSLVVSTLSQFDSIHYAEVHSFPQKKSVPKDPRFSSTSCFPDIFKRPHFPKKTCIHGKLLKQLPKSAPVTARNSLQNVNGEESEEDPTDLTKSHSITSNGFFVRSSTSLITADIHSEHNRSSPRSTLQTINDLIKDGDKNVTRVTRPIDIPGKPCINPYNNAVPFIQCPRPFRSSSLQAQTLPKMPLLNVGNAAEMERCGSASAFLESLQVNQHCLEEGSSVESDISDLNGAHEENGREGEPKSLRNRTTSC